MAQGVAAKAKLASTEELARDFATELIRWRGGMTAEAIVSEAFSLARAFENEAKKETNGQGQQG